MEFIFRIYNRYVHFNAMYVSLLLSFSISLLSLLSLFAVVVMVPVVQVGPQMLWHRTSSGYFSTSFCFNRSCTLQYTTAVPAGSIQTQLHNRATQLLCQLQRKYGQAGKSVVFSYDSLPKKEKEILMNYSKKKKKE